MAGLSLISFKGFVSDLDLDWHLESSETFLGFEMFPVPAVLSGKVIWFVRGTEFHCARLPKLLLYRDEQEGICALWEPGIKTTGRHINFTV